MSRFLQHARGAFLSLTIGVLALLSPAVANAAAASATTDVPTLSLRDVLANPGIYDSFCPSSAGAYKAMFNYFDYAQNARLMRCGSSTWGYRHIRDSRHDGFDDALDLDITNAFKNDHTPEPQGTSLKYNNFGFIVIYETKKQSDGAPKGIITAYLLAKR